MAWKNTVLTDRPHALDVHKAGRGRAPLGSKAALTTISMVLLGGIVLAGTWAAGTLALAPLRQALHASAMSFNPLTGRAILSGMKIEQDGTTILVDELKLFTSHAMLSAAFAAESFSLKNVTIEAAGFTYRSPSIDIVGASVTQKDLSAYLDRSAPKPFAEILASLSATSISIPEAAIDIGTGASKRVLELKGSALRNIASGKAETFSATGGALKGPSPVDGVFGAVSGKSIDLGALTLAMTERPVPLSTPLFTSLGAEKLQFKTAGGQLAIARLSSSDLKIPQRGGAMRTLPALGTFVLEDVGMDVARANATPAKWTMKKLSLTADAPNEGAPTHFAISADALALAIPVNTSDPSYKNLVELGYSTLAFSIAAEGNWIPATSDFTVKEVALRGDDIGTIGLRAVFGKVGRDFFSTDFKVAQAAANVVTVKELGIYIENSGLFERIVAREARKTGQSIDETRRQITAASAVAAARMTASTSGAEQVKAALLKFLNRPGKLKVAMKAKDAQGIKISTMRDPAAQKDLASHVEISAAAE